MIEPHTVAVLIGSTVSGAILGFIFAKRRLGPSGVAELTRLNRIAGIVDPSVPQVSTAKEWLPYPIAFAAGMCGLIIGLPIAGALSSPAATVAIDAAKLDQLFLAGCQKSCTSERGSLTVCIEYCDCLLLDLKSRHPHADDLVEFLSETSKLDSDAVAEMKSSRERCVASRK